MGVCDYAARFRPGYCMFLGPGPDKTWTNGKCEAARPEVNWDTKILADSSEIQRTLTQSFLAPLVLIRKPSNTKKGRESIHFNVSLATVSMICKLTESVNHVLLAVMNYMSDLQEKTPRTGEQHCNGKKEHLVFRKVAQCLKLPTRTRKKNMSNPQPHERPPGVAPPLPPSKRHQTRDKNSQDSQ